MTKEITSQVLEKIKKEDIKPEAKWRFLLKDYLVWGLFASSIIIGALAVATIIFGIKIGDWDMHRQLAGGPIRFLIMTLSYFWLLIFIAFISVAYYNFKHTKKGYKYNIFTIISISLLATLLLGGFAYSVGLGEKLENSLVRKAPFYKGMEHRRELMWNQQERGVLAGKILEVREGDFDLEDIKKMKWQVFMDKAEVMPVVILKDGNRVRLWGEKINTSTFKAHKIMPWQKPGSRKPTCLGGEFCKVK